MLIPVVVKVSLLSADCVGSFVVVLCLKLLTVWRRVNSAQWQLCGHPVLFPFMC